MSIAAPDWFKAASIEWSLGRATVQHTSQLSRFVQTVDLLAWQWYAIVTLPPAMLRDSGKYEALINSLAGGSDTLALHHMARPYPLGTMRGTPTLSTNAAQFANSLTVADAWNTSRRNFFPYSQQLNTWATSVENASITSDSSSAPDGTLTADLLKESLANAEHQCSRSESYGSAGIKVMSAYILSSGRNGQLAMYSTGNTRAARFDLTTGVATSITPSTEAGCEPVGGGWFRCWIKAPITNTAAPVQRVALVNGSGATLYSGDGSSGAYIWGIQLEDERLTDYIPTTTTASYASGTLKAGDMIGVSGQLFQVKSDCTANASGVLTVPLVNRSRRSITSGASVLWDKPTAEFYMMDPRSRSVYTPGFGGSQTIELVEKVS